MPTLALFQTLGPWEIIIILGFGVLLFGRRLPEVGRSLGRSIVEFKKGVKGISEEIDDESSKPGTSSEKPRPPLTAEGEDARVSRGEDVEVEQASAKVESQPPHPNIG